MDFGQDGKVLLLSLNNMEAQHHISLWWVLGGIRGPEPLYIGPLRLVLFYTLMQCLKQEEKMLAVQCSK